MFLASTSQGIHLVGCSADCAKDAEAYLDVPFVAVDEETVDAVGCMHCTWCGSRAFLSPNCVLCEGEGCPDSWTASLHHQALMDEIQGRANITELPEPALHWAESHSPVAAPKVLASLLLSQRVSWGF